MSTENHTMSEFEKYLLDTLVEIDRSYETVNLFSLVFESLMSGDKPSEVAKLLLVLISIFHELGSLKLPKHAHSKDVYSKIENELGIRKDLMSSSVWRKPCSYSVNIAETLFSTKRWRNTPLRGIYSVAIHSLLVGLLYYTSENVSTSECDFSFYQETSIKVAFLHDVLEAYSFDLSRPFKEVNYEIVREMDKKSLLIFKQDIATHFSSSKDIDILVDILQKGEFEDSEYHCGRCVDFYDKKAAWLEVRSERESERWLKEKDSEMLSRLSK